MPHTCIMLLLLSKAANMHDDLYVQYMTCATCRKTLAIFVHSRIPAMLACC